jgi:hypothetical protein
MTSSKLFGAALIASMAFATPGSAQVPLPGDYASEPSYASEPGLAAFYRPNSNVRVGSAGHANQMTVQPGRVDAGGLRLPTRPRRPYSSRAY